MEEHEVRCHGCSYVIDLYEEPAHTVYKDLGYGGTYLCEECAGKMSAYHKAKGVQSG